MNPRTLLPLASIVLIHAFGRYVFDPRSVDGFLLRPLLSIWFVGLGVTMTLTWVNHPFSRRLLLVWGGLTALGFLLDNIGILSLEPTPAGIVAWNWVGVGLGVALAVVAYMAKES